MSAVACPCCKSENCLLWHRYQEKRRGTWRTGRKLGRTIYIGDTLVGMVDTVEIAAEIVEAMNRPNGDADDL